MINKLKKLNPDLPFYSVTDKEFSSFGRVLNNLSTDGFLGEAEKLDYPKSGSTYLPSVQNLESVAEAKKIINEIYGEMPTQIGCCYGYNSLMNATEWHTSSEVNIAVTDLVLILGHIWDLEDHKIDSSAFKAFFVPKGTAIEVYATTLHFCPCQVSDDGFNCIVCLPKETNTPLEGKPNDPLLFRKNKWIIAHNENKALIDRGVVAGISGVNFKVNY